MGNVDSSFTFEDRENIALYRIRIGDKVLWAGTNQEDFHKQYQSAFDEYSVRPDIKQTYGPMHGPEMLLIQRLYGEPTPGSDVYSKCPNKSSDTYTVQIQKCRNGEMLCTLGTWQIIDTQPKEFKICIDERFPSTEEAVTKTIEYLNSKNF
ncbi:Hypothetical protein HVR_LOCUS1264 [uncultured virus]|nr:Hypothetical protein HVR_LOCUS1264 [uncultured virus]